MNTLGPSGTPAPTIKITNIAQICRGVHNVFEENLRLAKCTPAGDHWSPLQSIKITSNSKARSVIKPSPAGKGDRFRWMRRALILN